MDVQKANQEINEEFVAILQHLPKSMRDTIQDSMERGESYSYMFFMAGYLANKKKENNATGNNCCEFREGRSAI